MLRSELHMWFFVRQSRKILKTTVSFFMSVCPAVRMEKLGSHWIGFHECSIRVFFENLSRKFKFYQNLTRITCNLHEHQHTRVIISLLMLLRMRNISDKIYGENQTTRFIVFKKFFFKSCLLWDNAEKYCKARQATDDNLTRGTACWIPKATYTHSEYVVLIVIHCNNGCTNAAQCYLTCKLPVLFKLPWRVTECGVWLYGCLKICKG